MIFRVARRGVVLRLLKIRENVGGGPTGDPPVIVVLGRATVVEEDVGTRGPTEHFPTSEEHVPAIARLLPLGFKLPIINTLKKSQNPGRYANEFVVVIRSSSFEEKNFLAWIDREPIRQHTPSKTPP